MTNPTLVKEAVERFWPDEIFMARALRKSPSRKTIDLARTALAEFEPFKATMLASLPTDDDDTVERA